MYRYYMTGRRGRPEGSSGIGSNQIESNQIESNRIRSDRIGSWTTHEHDPHMSDDTRDADVDVESVDGGCRTAAGERDPASSGDRP